MKLRHFLHNLQTADEAVKNRWVWFLTIACGALVIAAWVGYVSLTVQGVTAAPSDVPARQGFLDVFRLGLASLQEQVWRGAGALLSERSVHLRAPELNFTAPLAPLPPISLP